MIVRKQILFNNTEGTEFTFLKDEDDLRLTLNVEDSDGLVYEVEINKEELSKLIGFLNEIEKEL